MELKIIAAILSKSREIRDSYCGGCGNYCLQECNPV